MDLMIGITGEVKEIADLFRELTGRQTEEVKLGLDGKKFSKELLEATHGTYAKEPE